MTSSEPWSRMFSGELSAIVVQCHVAAERVLRVNMGQPGKCRKIGATVGPKEMVFVAQG